jgi:hypothetical protein
MPTTRRRRVFERQDLLNPQRRHVLEWGSYETLWIPPDEMERRVFRDRDEVVRAWTLYRDLIMAEWSKRGDAGSRPWGFWTFDMPPERRLGFYPKCRGAELVYQLLKAGAIEPLPPGPHWTLRSEIEQIEHCWREWLFRAVRSDLGLAFAGVDRSWPCPAWFYRKHAREALEADAAFRAQFPEILPPRSPGEVARLLKGEPAAA